MNHEVAPDIPDFRRVEEFRRLFAEHPEWTGGSLTRRTVHRLLDDKVPATSKEVADGCIDLYRREAKKRAVSWSLDDPSEMRDRIKDLFDTDIHYALGAVFDAFNEQSEVGTSQHTQDVLGCVYDLIGLLYDMCRREGEVGQARLATLLRYMFDRHYQQDTRTAELLCSGDKQEYEQGDGTTKKWRLELNPEDLVIDLGCGDGSALRVFRTKTQCVQGFDFNPQYALRNKAVRVGVIDTSQERLEELGMGQLSFRQHFGKARFVFASLVMDRVASHNSLLVNCSELLLPEESTLALATLLPVSEWDDEPNIAQPMHYVRDPITAGKTVDGDYWLIAQRLKTLGFADVMRKKVVIQDPVTGREYQNHFLIIARKKGE